MLKKLKIDLTNCYGIAELSHEFDLLPILKKGGKAVTRAYAIYAPNGLMKTSFAKTFTQLVLAKPAKEERFGRQASAVVSWDDVAIQPEQVYVLRAEVDLQLKTDAVSSLLVNQQQKAEYEALLDLINGAQSNLVAELQKASGLKKDEIVKTLCADFGANSNLFPAVQAAMETALVDDFSVFIYNDFFNDKALTVLHNENFHAQAQEFSSRYNSLFEQAGTIYQKGTFNPIKAKETFNALDKQGYFKPGHRVHLAGEDKSRDMTEFQEKLEQVNKQINDDKQLRDIQDSIAKNVQTRAIAEFIESQPASAIEFLFDNVQSSKQQQFKQNLWAFYVQNSMHAASYLDVFSANKAKLELIEQQAAQESPDWIAAIQLFNQRFLDMPFKLDISNHADAVLGKDAARLICKFANDQDNTSKTYHVSDIEQAQLSQGEKRAFYLLNFIFEVERRKRSQQPTLFIVDDPADSFDYKNKHAIVQYLTDLNEVEHFAQIVLTHNFDFYRSLATYVNRTRCLMANRTSSGIQLVQADGINNIFTKKWKVALSKHNPTSNEVILCATIPFTRNIIEYTCSDQDSNYLKLTSLLHWKSDTEQITAKDYWSIYSATFANTQPYNSTQPMVELIFELADTLSGHEFLDSLNLENKVLLSMAIRLKAEKYMTQAIRVHKDEPTYWFETHSNQYAGLIKYYKELHPASAELPSLEKVSVTVSSNIHLNSFMYEPILDLTMEHLVGLYAEINELVLQYV